MDTRLIRHYEQELAFIREMGAEFAEAYPKIAARLGLEGTEVLDPFVERLLESFAFLSSRVHLELELQYPNFTNNLLEIIYPHYLAPTPSMAVMHFEPDEALAGLPDGFDMPRHTPLRTGVVAGGQTACSFRTAHDLTLWPMHIVEAEYIDSRGALISAGLGRDIPARAGIRLRFRRMTGAPLKELTADKVTLYLQGQGGANWMLHELLSTQVEGVLARSTNRRDDWKLPLPGAEVTPRGYGSEDALLPTPARSFDGYRLLQEYFAMPERFHFMDLSGLRPAFQRADGSDVDIYLLLRDGDAEAQAMVTPEAFSIHAAPAVNLFDKLCDRVPITVADYEQHVIPDRTAMLDYEVYQVKSVRGIRASGETDVEFLPFYSQNDRTVLGENYPAFYAQRRRMRQRSERERLKGPRTSYLGSEMFLNLVDQNQAPFSSSLDQLSVRTVCTNRDLPLLLATGAPDVFHLPQGGPVKSITTPVVPTRPRPSFAHTGAPWRLVGHLSLNYLSIADTAFGGGAEALRELIGLYAPPDDRSFSRQLEGIVSLTSRPIVRRLPDEVLSTPVKGLEITLDFDEQSFEGARAFTLAAVLEKFFRKYATLNSFTETVLRTQQRGEVTRWDAMSGLSQIV